MRERSARGTRARAWGVLIPLALGLGCATSIDPADGRVVTTYRLFDAGKCDALRSFVSEIDWSTEDTTRKPFFDLMQGYCLELDGEIEDASALYANVIVDAPATEQAYEASLRLGEIRRLSVGGASRETLRASKTPKRSYQHGADPILRIPAVHPSALRTAGIDGFVLVDFAITPTGATEDPIVLDSKPPFIFDAAALGAIRQWVYEPTQSQRPRRSRVRLDFESTN